MSGPHIGIFYSLMWRVFFKRSSLLNWQTYMLSGNNIKITRSYVLSCDFGRWYGCRKKNDQNWPKMTFVPKKIFHFFCRRGSWGKPPLLWANRWLERWKIVLQATMVVIWAFSFFFAVTTFFKFFLVNMCYGPPFSNVSFSEVPRDFWAISSSFYAQLANNTDKKPSADRQKYEN